MNNSSNLNNNVGETSNAVSNNPNNGTNPNPFLNNQSVANSTTTQVVPPKPLYPETDVRVVNGELHVSKANPTTGNIDINKENVPDAYKPLSVWGYIGYNFLFSLPIVGFVMLIVYAVNNDNINRRNYARSFLLLAGIMIVLVIVLFVIFGFSFGSGTYNASYGY